MVLRSWRAFIDAPARPGLPSKSWWLVPSNERCSGLVNELLKCSNALSNCESNCCIIIQRDPEWLAKKNGCQMAPGVDIFSQLSPILRSAGTSVYSSGQVFVQAEAGSIFFVSNFFKGQFGVSLLLLSIADNLIG